MRDGGGDGEGESNDVRRMRARRGVTGNIDMRDESGFYSLCFHGDSTSRTVEHLPHNCLSVQSFEVHWFTNLCVCGGGRGVCV